MPDYAKECLDIADDNFISIKNKNSLFNTTIQYSKKYKKFIILVLHKTNEGELYGNAYDTLTQIFDWVDRNIDEHYHDNRGSYNIKFNFRVDWASEHKGRLFHTLDCYEKDADFKKLLMLLLI
jgi:hypothetical protein